MQKVLFYCPDAAPIFDNLIKTPIGGAELRAYNFGKYLAAKNNKVFFLVNELTQPLIIIDKVIAKSISYFKKERLSFSKKIYYKIKYFFKYKNKISYEDFLKKKEVFDILPQHICSFGITKNTCSIAYVSNIINSNFYLFIASDEDLNFVDLNENSKTKLNVNYKLADKILKSAKIVFVQNDFQHNILKNIFKINSQVLLNPINLKNNSINNTKEFILWVGKSSWYKNPHLIIKIAKELKKFKFLMICNETELTLHSEIKNLIPENCEFIEYVPASEIEVYFAKCQIFISTSEFEGFPNTFLQAAKYGKPIISYKVNPNNFITKYNCGFCASGNYNLMLEEILKVLEDNELYTYQSTNAKLYIENHDIEKIGSSLEKYLLKN